MFTYLYRTLYESLLQPDDDFFTRCRKAVITVFFVFGIINIIISTASTITSKDAWTVVRIVVSVIGWVLSVIWIVSWTYARRTRTSPDWLLNLVLDLSLCFLVLTHFSSANWGYHALCLSAAICAVLVGASHMKFQVALSAILFLINAYDTLGFPSILLPGSFKGSALTRQITNSVAASLALWAVYLAMKQFSLLIKKSSANVQMAKEVSKMLAGYDTARALALLSAREESDDTLDASLVAVLKEIAHNLDKYRPHLPNHLLHQESGNNDADRRKLVIPQGGQKVKATSVLGYIFNFLYTDLLQPEDDFSMRARKGCISLWFLFAVFSAIAQTMRFRSGSSLVTLADYIQTIGGFINYSIQISANS